LQWVFRRPGPGPYPLYGLEKHSKVYGDAKAALNTTKFVEIKLGFVITEGEKSADAAQKVFPTRLCMTSPFGCKSSHLADWTPLKGRDVVIWRDLDEPGVGYQNAIAAILLDLGCTVSVVDVAKLAWMTPDGGQKATPPKDGWDSDDALDEWKEADALRAAVEKLIAPYEATDAETVGDAEAPDHADAEAPDDVGAGAADDVGAGDDVGAKARDDHADTDTGRDHADAKTSDRKTTDRAELRSVFDPWAKFVVPSFPFDVLQPVRRDFVTTQSTVTGGDPSAIAMAALTALSGAISHETTLRMTRHDSGFQVSACLWGLLVGDPGTMKTPVIRSVTSQHRRRQVQELKDYQRELKLWKEADKENRGPPPIKPPVRLTNDTTVEALCIDLANYPIGTLTAADELAGWLGQMEKYSKGSSADRAIWLQARNGGPYNVHRVSRDDVNVENLSSSLLGGIQADRLAEIVGLSSDGLIQRFVPVMMQQATLAKDLPLTTSTVIFERLVERCLDTQTLELTMTDEARDARVQARLGRRFQPVDLILEG
jgi:hypothetical protein